MNKTILLLTALSVMLTAIIQSCSNPTKNVQNNIFEGNAEVIVSGIAYLGDIEQYRKETAETIESYCQHIAALKSGIDGENDCGNQYNYRHSIFVLELYNSYMKKKLDDYKPQGQESWEIFKKEFTHQMDDLNKEFADFEETIQKAMPDRQYY